MKFKLSVILTVAIASITLGNNLDDSHDIKLDSGDTLRVTAVSSNILRVRLSEDGQFTQALMNRYGIINEDWPKVDVSIKESDGMVFIKTDRVILKVDKASGKMQLLSSNGNSIVESIEPLTSKLNDAQKDQYSRRVKSLADYFRANAAQEDSKVLLGGCPSEKENILGDPTDVVVESDKEFDSSIKPFSVTFSLKDQERFYGLGASSGERIQLRGHGYRNIAEYKNHNGYDYKFAKFEQTEQPMPFVLSSEGWGMYLNTTFFNFFDIGRMENDKMIAWAPRGELDFYLFASDSLADSVDTYTQITGRPVMLPLKCYGLNYLGHITQDHHQVLYTALNFREREFPCDVYSMGPEWTKKFYDFSHERDWDNFVDFHIPSWLPNDWSMIGALKRMNFDFRIWLCSRDDYTIEEERQIAIKEGRSLEAFEGKPAAFYDHLKKFTKQGVRGYMIDPADTINRTPWVDYFGGKSEMEIHNLQQTLIHKQMYEGYREQTKLRPMSNYCGGYTGTQKYSTTTMGDNGGGEKALSWMLNLGFAGHTNITCDMEIENAGIHLGFIQPISRLCNWASTYEPWFMLPHHKEMFKYYSELHYRLIPYAYSEAYRANRTGMPVLRPMPLMFGDDINCANLTKQYMYGDWLLSAVFTNSVYLPEGKWIDYWTGKEYQGGQTVKPQLPEKRGGFLFVRAGAIIPYWPQMQYVGEKSTENITLEIYPHGSSSFTLYEDDGDSLEHENGRFAITEINSREEGKKIFVNISPRKGSYNGMPKTRSFDLKIYTKKPRKITVNGKTFSASRWTYNVDKKFVSINVSEDMNKEKDISICLK